MLSLSKKGLLWKENSIIHFKRKDFAIPLEHCFPFAIFFQKGLGTQVSIQKSPWLFPLSLMFENLSSVSSPLQI